MNIKFEKEFNTTDVVKQDISLITSEREALMAIGYPSYITYMEMAQFIATARPDDNLNVLDLMRKCHFAGNEDIFQGRSNARLNSLQTTFFQKVMNETGTDYSRMVLENLQGLAEFIFRSKVSALAHSVSKEGGNFSGVLVCPPTPPSIEQAIPEIIAPKAYMKLGKEMYAVKFEKTGLADFDDLKGKAYQSLRENIKLSYQAQEQSLKKEMRILEEKVLDAKASGVKDLIVFLAKIPDWKPIIYNDRPYFYHEKRMVATKVLKEKTLYSLPRDMIGKFYVEKIYVPASNIKSVSGATCEKGYHVNVTGSAGNGLHSYTMCIGDLVGRPLEYVLPKFEDCFDTLNLDSTYGGASAAYLREHWSQISGDVIEDATLFTTGDD